MPTAYTQELCEKGQTFEAFALACARQFGALIMMRDDPLDAPIPKFEPSDHSKTAGIAAEATRKRLLAMNAKQRRAFGAQRKRLALGNARDWLKREAAVNKRLNRMRSIVQAWKPPTKNHEGLKEFMLQQIATSTHDLNYIHRQIEKARAQVAMEYYEMALVDAQCDIEYHAKNYLAEVERANERNVWVDQLRASLK